MFQHEKDGFVFIKKGYNFQDFLQVKLKEVAKFQYNKKELSDFQLLMKSLWNSMTQNDKTEFFNRL